MKSKIIILIITLFSSISYAQSKVGTINSDYILQVMPERATAIKLSGVYGKKLDTLFSVKVLKYQKSLAEFKLMDASVSQEIKKAKFVELGDLEASVNKSKEKGTQLMRLKENELMKPLLTKLGKAISDVAIENGYTQILTLTGNEFAYIDPKFDITDLVMKKLNIKIPAPNTPK
jgi:outer membrane protein